MEKSTAITIFESLSSGVRLDVYRLLVNRGTEGLVAGEIASTLDVPPTNLSFHLKALTQAGLLTVQQEGRFQRYRANLPLMVELITFLTQECCSGHPELCLDTPVLREGAVGPGRVPASVASTHVNPVDERPVR